MVRYPPLEGGPVQFQVQLRDFEKRPLSRWPWVTDYDRGVYVKMKRNVFMNH
jgi:hypothetical protein